MFPPRCSKFACMNIDVTAVSGQSCPTTAHERSTSQGWNASSLTACSWSGSS